MAELEDLYVGQPVWHPGMAKGGLPWAMTVVKIHAQRVTVSFDQFPMWQHIRVNPKNLTPRTPKEEVAP